MSMITEFCRRGECSLCQNPACEHMCHQAPAVELGPASLSIIGVADCDSAPDPDPLIPRPKRR